MSTPVRSLCIDAFGSGERISPQQTDVLARLLDMDPADIDRIYAAKHGFVWLKREMPLDVAERAMRLGIPGLFAQQDYPTAAPIPKARSLRR